MDEGREGLEGGAEGGGGEEEREREVGNHLDLTAQMTEICSCSAFNRRLLDALGAQIKTELG